MQVDILIPSIAAATCLQVSLFFLVLWLSRRNQGQLLMFSLFTAFICVMVVSALVMQIVSGPNAPRCGLIAYKIQMCAICGAVSTLLSLASRVSNRPIHGPVRRHDLWVVAVALACLACTPLVLRLPSAGTPVANYDDADRGPLFVPFVLAMVAAVGYASQLLWNGVQRQRRLPGGGYGADDAYFGDLRFFLMGVLLFLPAAIYEIVLAMGWIGQPAHIPIARSLSVMALCGLTGQMLVTGIVENDRRRRRAEIVSRANVETMSYAAHQVRGNLDNVLWQLRSCLEHIRHRDPGDAAGEGVQAAIDEANELLRIFNTMLLAARDAAGHSMNLSPRRNGRMSEFVERLCRKRVEGACRSMGWNGVGCAPYAICFHSDLTEPFLYSRDAVQHIVAILIDNAVKYSEPGMKIDVRIWRENDRVILRIRDYGIGIPPGDEQLIFEPYQRGSATGGSIPGNGIGLTLARRLAQSQAGELRVDHDFLGPGSAFRLTLPFEYDE